MGARAVCPVTATARAVGAVGASAGAAPTRLTTRDGAGSAEQPDAIPSAHTPTATPQLLLTGSRRVQNKMRQHTLQAARANALHAQ
jgi:hypothetical protein